MRRQRLFRALRCSGALRSRHVGRVESSWQVGIVDTVTNARRPAWLSLAILAVLALCLASMAVTGSWPVL